jgi:radical SAM family uncharacterized protein/radical SAM-linked protein
MYEIGMSHFGIQILYAALNRHPEIWAQRVFAPDVDMQQAMVRDGVPLSTLESRRPVKTMDVVGFSLLYELNYTNVVGMLDLAGIPRRAEDRDVDAPLVIAGGPCSCNPEPVAEFFDAMVLGDGEQAVVEMSEAQIRWKKSGDHGKDKNLLLHRWSDIDGVYVPRFYHARFDSRGFQHTRPRQGRQSRIRRAYAVDLNDAVFPDRPVVPFGRPVHDRLRIEVSRGCSRGCRFCQAGMIYRPVRERSVDELLRITDGALKHTGYDEISLLSLSTGDYQALSALMSRIMRRCAPERIAVSLPSFRAGSLSPQLMALIKTVRKTGFTIAPEAGSQRLRNVINKNLTEKQIVETVAEAFRAGWDGIKLYFMIGLPTETMDDLDELVALVRRLRGLRSSRGRRGRINVGIATFIPKPHTPFQWSEQLPLEAAIDRIGWLRERLQMSGVQVKWQHPKVSLIEGLWSRGDRRLSRLLTAAVDRRCRFDGWSDHFRYDAWMAAMEATGIDVHAYTSRNRSLDEPLPWDHIDMGVTKTFLRKEYEAALQERLTGDCRGGECNTCGVCDFSEVFPVVSDTGGAAGPPPERPLESRANPARTVCVTYQKLGPGRFLGHLELVKCFHQALRRAGIPVSYSGGFHPLPKVSFTDPLPVGIESEQETLWIRLSGDITEDALCERLNAQLPEGLSVTACLPELKGKDRRRRPWAHYRIASPGADAGFDLTVLRRFEAAEQWPVRRRSRKGALQMLDLKDMVKTIRPVDAATIEAILRNEAGRMYRPADLLRELFGISPAAAARFRVRKLKRHHD